MERCIKTVKNCLPMKSRSLKEGKRMSGVLYVFFSCFRFEFLMSMWFLFLKSISLINYLFLVLTIRPSKKRQTK